MSVEIRFLLGQKCQKLVRDLPYENIKNKIMGKRYSLSLAFVGDKRSTTLNKTYRGKNTPANILSFPLSKNEGEIIINPHQARRDAKHHTMVPGKFVGYLFIHGLLHLKGCIHGSTMNREEERLLKKFDIV